MIKFIEPGAVNVIVIDGISFNFKSISVRDKLGILSALGDLDNKDIVNTLDEIKKALSGVILSIKSDNESIPFDKVFEDLVDFDSIKEIMTAVITYCSPKEAQVKNSNSSPGQPSPVSAGNAENSAAPDGGPVGITRE